MWNHSFSFDSSCACDDGSICNYARHAAVCRHATGILVMSIVSPTTLCWVVASSATAFTLTFLPNTK